MVAKDKKKRKTKPKQKIKKINSGKKRIIRKGVLKKLFG
tara:strand:+ start:1676 stop:1792 length:117 start_codon:yes stop_codon:yes gene_type:complete